MGKTKYHLIGLNRFSGSFIEIEFNDPKNFSRSGLADTLLLPKDDPKGYKGIVEHNKGAKGFMNGLIRELEIGAKELDKEIDDIYIIAETKILRDVARIKKAEEKKSGLL